MRERQPPRTPVLPKHLFDQTRVLSAGKQAFFRAYVLTNTRSMRTYVRYACKRLFWNICSVAHIRSIGCAGNKRSRAYPSGKTYVRGAGGEAPTNTEKSKRTSCRSENPSVVSITSLLSIHKYPYMTKNKKRYYTEADKLHQI